MLKNVFYRKTGEDFEFWFEFEAQILHHSTDGVFSIVEQIPGDAQEIPRTDDPQATGKLHRSIPGSRLVGIYHDEPHTLKFDNGSAISVVFDYPYSDPTLGSYYTLDFYSAEHIATDSVLSEYVDKICVEANRIDICSLEEKNKQGRNTGTACSCLAHAQLPQICVVHHRVAVNPRPPYPGIPD